MRQLATIRKIQKIEEISGANSIELAHIDGWQCVIKKGEFKEGDLGVYFEIDSIVPDHPVFDFMRPRKFRVKTIKCMKVISQGLLQPLYILIHFPASKLVHITEGLDVTNIIGVTKYDPELIAEQNCVSTPKKPIPWYIRYARKLPLIGKYFQQTKGTFPTHIVAQTDEVRYQNMTLAMKEEFLKNRKIEITEKLDGTSSTFIYKPRPWYLFFLGPEFLVCSRTMTKIHEDDSWWWNVAHKYSMKEKMAILHHLMGLDSDTYLVIQGETIGPKIQGNKYKVNDFEFYIFNLIVTNGKTTKRYNWKEINEFVSRVELEQVPLIGEFVFSLEDVMEFDIECLDFMLTKRERWGLESKLNPACKISEGVVVRLHNPNVNSLRSFKYVYPEFSEKADKND